MSVLPSSLRRWRWRRVAAVIKQAKRRQRRRRLLLTTIVALAAAAGVGVYLGVWQGDGTTGAPGSGGSGLAVVRFRLAAAPVAVTLAGGSVWVVEETSGMRAVLVRLDATTGKRLTAFTIGRTGPDFGAAAASGHFVWAAAGDHVIRVDTTRPGVVRRTALPGEAAAVTIGFGSAWVATIGQQHDAITRLDASTLAMQARVPLTIQPVALGAGLGSVWVASTGGLWKIDPTSNRLISAPVPVAVPVRLAVSGNRVWLIEQDRFIIAVDRAGRVRARIALPFAPGAVAATPGRIWVTDDCGCRAGTLALVDARTHRLLGERKIGETPVDVAAGRDGAWIATFGDSSVSHINTTG